MYRKSSVIYTLCYLLICLCLLLILFINFDWKTSAYISVILIILSIFYLKLSFDINIFSFSSLFIICLWLFHCGQIMNYGLDIKGTNYLFFMDYGSELSSIKAFVFYFASQILFTIFIGIGNKKSINYRSIEFSRIPKYLPFFLFAIGIGPRLYYDFSYLNYGLLNGYHGTALYIPQFVNTLAFFADAAVLMKLLTFGEKKSATVLFVIVVAYKSIMMLSGSRQESFVFIIMFSYIYFFINKKVKTRQLLIYVIIGYFILAFIMTVGEIRVGSFQSISVFFDIFLEKASLGFFGDMFGEFGSAFTTLVKTINDTPSQVQYGFGLSYVTGILSAIPTFVSKIPVLSDMTAYIVQYRGIANFGGSILGELFFNFGWIGLCVTPIIGRLIGNINLSIERMKNANGVNMQGFKSTILAIALLLLVRGYFSDMVQKIVWLFITVNVFNRFIKRGKYKND